MKKIKPLVFEESWTPDYWSAITVFSRYTIHKCVHKGYKDKIVYEIEGVQGLPKRRSLFEEAIKVAQKDWENRLSKIEDCYDICE